MCLVEPDVPVSNIYGILGGDMSFHPFFVIGFSCSDTTG